MLGVYSDKDYINYPLISVCRNPKIIETVEFVLNNKTNSYVDLESNKQFYKSYNFV